MPIEILNNIGCTDISTFENDNCLAHFQIQHQVSVKTKDNKTMNTDTFEILNDLGCTDLSTYVFLNESIAL